MVFPWLVKSKRDVFRSEAPSESELLAFPALVNNFVPGEKTPPTALQCLREQLSEHVLGEEGLPRHRRSGEGGMADSTSEGRWARGSATPHRGQMVAPWLGTQGELCLSRAHRHGASWSMNRIR